MITLKSDVDVTCVDSAGNEMKIAQSAWASTGRTGTNKQIAGLINTLIKQRHGTPFEDGYFKFEVHAPIFVAREWMRHRIGWSYSEMSARYTELEPIFWVPHQDRGLVNAGTGMRPKLVSGTGEQHDLVLAELNTLYEDAWIAYQQLLAHGIAKEVARACLPVGIYTRFMARCNPRSLMHFLSLRTHDPEAHFVSYPQAEIEEAARQMEEYLASYFPLTHAAFVKHGRVSP